MPDLSVAFPTPELEQAFLDVVDVEGKLIAALEDLGPVANRDVVLLDAGAGVRVRQLEEIGARVTAVVFPDSCDADQVLACIAELPLGLADTVIVLWSELASPGSAFIAEAQRLLRPRGRLLVVHDYGRDDVWKLQPERCDRAVAWSQRRGPFLSNEFRVRVLHCWWTFESAEHAHELLTAGFGPPGADLAGRMKRPRLEYTVAIYHRWAPDKAVDTADCAAGDVPLEPTES